MHFQKLVRVMKVTAVLLLITCLQLSAHTNGQTVTLSVKEAPMKEVFRKIQKQTGLNILVKESLLEKAGRVTLEVRNMPVEEVLALCFRDRQLRFSIESGIIVVQEKPGPVIRPPGETPVEIRVSGRVVNEKGEGLAAASVIVRGEKGGTIQTGSSGGFSIIVHASEAVLVVSYVGYQTKEVRVSGADVELVIRLEPDVQQLQEATVYSTGYQSIPKERVTGSFEKIDNKAFNYTAGIDILSHLEGVTASMVYNNKSAYAGLGRLTNTTIRGPSTLTPLIGKALVVLDNMAYYGDINTLNPNDVESITLLKDAAAASIWGAQAGNGVIVITTKKGKYNRPFSVSVNSNVRISPKPNLGYLQQVSTSEFIEIEKQLFDQGVFDSDLDNSVPGSFLGGPLVSPVVQLLAKARSGVISQAEANSQIDALRNYNFRDDILKYYYRNEVSQQYAINISEGNDRMNYLLSAGYDKVLANIHNTENDRITLRSQVVFKPIKNLEAGVTLAFFKSSNSRGNSISEGYLPSSSKAGMYPYARLADDQGNPLPVPLGYNIGWAQDNGTLQQLDWTYTPLNDRDKSSFTDDKQDVLLNLNLNYRLSPVFKAQVLYQYNTSNNENREVHTANSYKMRDLINMFTVFDANNQIVRNLPMGGSLDMTSTHFVSQSVRGQIDADKTWGRHQLAAIAGAELRHDVNTLEHPATTYGWDDELLSFKTVNYNELYPYYGLTFYTVPIPFSSDFRKSTYNGTSIYANGSYTYNKKYILTVSARKDASNLFGVKTNQKGTPLWSAGLGWNISNETFYKLPWMPFLKLRATYGYSGNVNNTLSAYLTMRSRGNDYVTQLPWAEILNPPNPGLKWENVKTINLGIDFGSSKNRISGTVEYYRKNSERVYALAPVDPTGGFNVLTTNSGAITGTGVDLLLNTKNIETKTFNWSSNFILSVNKSVITKYDYDFTARYPQYLVKGEGVLGDIEGYDAYPLFSYKFAGLDASGNPQGYVDNKLVSADGYPNSYDLTEPDSVNQLVYHGSTLPRTYGSLRNTFSWKGLELSVNIMYRLGYYFRKNTVDYNSLKDWYIHSDIRNRWMKPGDEQLTTVPGMPADFSDWTLSYRDAFYRNSAVNVAKADHIRLQNIMLSYSISKPQWHIQNLKIYANVVNAGILWRANKWGIDPETPLASAPSTPTFIFGLNAGF